MAAIDERWTAALRARWQAIESHAIGGVANDAFRSRLAREQAWSAGEAAQAIVEYRRFCFVARVAGHEATPSEEVDAVWHLHLLHTRDYWQHFCPQALGAELHHGPTRGAVDAARFREQYAMTLQAYERYFGPPPARWWPDAHVRFARRAPVRAYDPARHWLLPRPRWPRPLRALGAALAAMFAPAASAALPANPLDWNGGDFLLPFTSCMALALLAGLVLRGILKSTLAGPATGGSALTTWETAWLAGGAPRVIDAGVAELHRLGRFDVDASGRPLAIGAGRELDEPLRSIHEAVAQQGRVPSILGQATPRLGAIRESLVRRGLWFDAATASRIALLSALPWVLLLGLGLAKIAVGLSRDKPVLFLAVLCVLCAIAALVSSLKRPGATPAGAALLRQSKKRHATLARAPRAEQLALAVALMGTGVLAGTALAAWHEARHPPSSGGDGGSSSSDSSDSSSGDGGGSGCGGCGGGGGD